MILLGRSTTEITSDYDLFKGEGVARPHKVCMLLVHLKSFQSTISLKEICDGRRLCPKIIHMSSLPDRKSGNISSLDECS